MSDTKSTSTVSVVHLVIITKYLSATNHRGARIKASLPKFDVTTKTYPWDYAGDPKDNHAKAAGDFAERWADQYARGADVDLQGGYVGDGKWAWTVRVLD